MSPLCKWPEEVGVPIVSGDSQCSDVVLEVFGHLRGYLCPHALAGIYPKLVLVENSSRDRLRSSSFPEDSVYADASLWAPSQPTIFMGTATAPSQELGVGGIPTVVRFGGIQLVWHLVLLSSKKLVRLPWRAGLQSISLIALSQRFLAPPSKVQSNLCVGRITCLCSIAHFRVLPKSVGRLVTNCP